MPRQEQPSDDQPSVLVGRMQTEVLRHQVLRVLQRALSSARFDSYARSDGRGTVNSQCRPHRRQPACRYLQIPSGRAPLSSHSLIQASLKGVGRIREEVVSVAVTEEEGIRSEARPREVAP